MKTTLSLSFEEGLEVIQAMRNVALESGWTEDELKDSDVIEEYSKVLDAALEAMGIEVNVSTEPSEEEEEEDTTQYSLTPKGEFVRKYMEKHKEQGVSFEEACEVADILFGESQEEEEDEKEEEDDDEELPSDEEVFQMIKQMFGGL